jgi:hypothetical protein
VQFLGRRLPLQQAQARRQPASAAILILPTALRPRVALLPLGSVAPKHPLLAIRPVRANCRDLLPPCQPTGYSHAAFRTSSARPRSPSCRFDLSPFFSATARSSSELRLLPPVVCPDGIHQGLRVSVRTLFPDESYAGFSQTVCDLRQPFGRHRR